MWVDRFRGALPAKQYISLEVSCEIIAAIQDCGFELDRIKSDVQQVRSSKNEFNSRYFATDNDIIDSVKIYLNHLDTFDNVGIQMLRVSVSLFNGISTFVGNLIPKPML